MKKSQKVYFFILSLVFILVSCRNVMQNKSISYVIPEETQENSSSQVSIGDYIVYGNSFSYEDYFNDLYETMDDTARIIKARTAREVTSVSSLNDEDFIKMVYFSVLPTSMKSLRFVNDKIGFLNPAELDKEIIQACDAEKLIFKNTTDNIEDYENEEIINLDIKYYYILPKEEVALYCELLEGFDVIEEFEILSDDALQRLQSEYGACLETYENELNNELYESECRGLLGNLFNSIKKVVTNTVAAIQSLTKTYEINGTLKYTIGSKEYAAYGIKVTNIGLGGGTSLSDKSGDFKLGSLSNIAGPCSIWLEYKNAACHLTNFMDLNAQTLVKTGLPSTLSNITVKNVSGYANSKMAVCSDLLKRYEDEKTRLKKVPKARIWVTEFLEGTSSAPCFNRMGYDLPDIILTGLSSMTEDKMRVLHHEYTHFIHHISANNKNDFWKKIISSEILCTVYSNLDSIAPYIKNYQSYKRIVSSNYDFENPYVCFAENLADWYSFVGCYSKGSLNSSTLERFGIVSPDSTFTNRTVFSELIKAIVGNLSAKNPSYDKYLNMSEKFMSIVDKYDITTFNEFYSALLKEYPNKKTEIDNAFKSYYIMYGSNSGNTINY